MPTKPKAKRSVASERSISVATWAKPNSAAWNRTVKGVFDVGRLLLKAEAALRRDDFSELTRAPGEPGKLPFGYETARRLMTIAEDKRLARILAHGSKMRPPAMLPPHWRTLYELTRLSTEQLTRALKDGRITAEMHRYEVDHIRDGYFDDATASPESKPSPPSSTLISVKVRDATRRISVPYDPVPAPVSRSSNLRLVASNDAAKTKPEPETSAEIERCVVDVKMRVRASLDQVSEDQRGELFAQLHSALEMLEHGGQSCG